MINHDYLLRWMHDNMDLLIGFVCNNKLTFLTPYDVSDFVQDAIISAIVVAERCNENKRLNFNTSFWRKFSDEVRGITPSRIYGSNSVGSHLCDRGLALVSNIADDRDHNLNIDYDHIYGSIRHFLTRKEQIILDYSLGFGSEGHLSNYEIANKIQCSVSNVRGTQNRAFERIKELVRKGSIDPKMYADNYYVGDNL